MSQRIAIFGGSFDPVHVGHLLLAQDALEDLQLDRLVFVPAGINPHKLDTAPKASAAARLEMLKLATEGESRFYVDPLELERTGPSFTIETIECFQKRWPNSELFLLLGEDNLPKLDTWHRFEDLRKAVTFVLFGRGQTRNTMAAVAGSAPLKRLQRQVDVSSTEIRLRIAQGRSIRYLVWESVRLLIQSHALYQLPDQRDAGPPLRHGGP